jgi:hypothetical protein
MRCCLVDDAELIKRITELGDTLFLMPSGADLEYSLHRNELDRQAVRSHFNDLSDNYRAFADLRVSISTRADSITSYDAAQDKNIALDVLADGLDRRVKTLDLKTDALSAQNVSEVQKIIKLYDAIRSDLLMIPYLTTGHPLYLHKLEIQTFVDQVTHGALKGVTFLMPTDCSLDAALYNDIGFASAKMVEIYRNSLSARYESDARQSIIHIIDTYDRHYTVSVTGEVNDLKALDIPPDELMPHSSEMKLIRTIVNMRGGYIEMGYPRDDGMVWYDSLTSKMMKGKSRRFKNTMITMHLPSDL